MSSTSLARPSPATARAMAPSTPLRPSSAPSTPQKPAAQEETPGTWRHPNMDEINRRMNASTFNADNMHSVLLNALALVLLLLSPTFLYSYTPSVVVSLLQAQEPYATYALLFVRAIPVLNMVVALMPLFRPQDDMTDIALSREQRKLLGLKPQDTPLPAGAAYVTPPRYSRSSTPRSSAQRAPSGSPLSQKGQSPSSFDTSTFGASKTMSGSPFSVSPLMQKAIGGASARRASMDQSLGTSTTSALGSGKASVGLNSKWLYQRGPGSPSGGRAGHFGTL